MQRALAAARRAFDETDWSINHALRKRCLAQLQEASESEREELREELRPVLCVIAYDDDDDAVRIANESGYGLSGGVFSASEERAPAVARRIRTGSIGINGGVWYGADSPYGGYKSSGIGRQNSREGFDASNKGESYD